MISKELEYSEQNSDPADRSQVESTSNIVTQESFSLLEERLRIELIQNKIGEIVIRKEIATHLVSVQIPVMREKLIVEQVSPVYKLLAEIDLDRDNNSNDLTVNSIDSNEDPSSSIRVDVLHENLDPRINPPTVYGSTDSLKAASELLNEIASLSSHDCGAIRIEIVLKKVNNRSSYQALVDRYCQV
jgi:hypothetical protein